MANRCHQELTAHQTFYLKPSIKDLHPKCLATFPKSDPLIEYRFESYSRYLLLLKLYRHVFLKKKPSQSRLLQVQHLGTP